MNIAIISANISGIDIEIDDKLPFYESPHNWNLDYFFYSDKNYPKRINSLHPRLQAKIPKMLGYELHPGYDFYIWIDGSIRIKNPKTIEWLVSCCFDSDIALFQHPYRTSIKDELEYINTNMEKGSEYLISRYFNEPMNEQVSLYLDDKLFIDNSLFALGCFIYNKSIIPTGILKEWFYHNARYSIQDQLSLPYLLSKIHVEVAVLKEDIFNNEYLEYIGHKK